MSKFNNMCIDSQNPNLNYRAKLLRPYLKNPPFSAVKIGHAPKKAWLKTSSDSPKISVIVK